LDYKITFKKSVAKDLKKISPENVNRVLNKISVDLPSKADLLPVLQEQFSGLKKFRVGDYRIIFTIIDSILILRVQHRKVVYRD